MGFIVDKIISYISAMVDAYIKDIYIRLDIVTLLLWFSFIT